MCWAACDRLAKIAARARRCRRARRSGATRADDDPRRASSTQAWNEKRQAFVESFGGSELDASVLLMAEVGFIAAARPALRQHRRGARGARCATAPTCAATRRPTTSAGPRPRSTSARSGASTRWRASAAASEAREIFEALLARRNHVGLLSRGHRTRPPASCGAISRRPIRWSASSTAPCGSRALGRHGLDIRDYTDAIEFLHSARDIWREIGGAAASGLRIVVILVAAWVGDQRRPARHPAAAHAHRDAIRRPRGRPARRDPRSRVPLPRLGRDHGRGDHAGAGRDRHLGRARSSARGRRRAGDRLRCPEPGEGLLHRLLPAAREPDPAGRRRAARRALRPGRGGHAALRAPCATTTATSTSCRTAPISTRRQHEPRLRPGGGRRRRRLRRGPGPGDGRHEAKSARSCAPTRRMRAASSTISRSPGSSAGPTPRSILRARFRVAALEQWNVKREYLRRLKRAFDEHAIEIPFPQTDAPRDAR